MRKVLLKVSFILVLILFSSSLATAQTAKSKAGKKKPEQELSIGVMCAYIPDYEGSDFYEYKALPSISYNYGRYFLGMNGLGLFLIKEDFLSLSTSLGYNEGREEDDAMILHGTGDIDEGASGNVNLEIELGLFSLGAKYSKQFTGENTGYTISYSLGLTIPMSKYFIVSTSVEATYGSDIYMEKYFGISSTQSTNSGLPVYEAESGFKDVGCGLVLILNLSEHVSTQIISKYSRFIGDAKDSPIVLDKNQYFTAVGISYKF